MIIREGSLNHGRVTRRCQGGGLKVFTSGLSSDIDYQGLG